MVEQDERGRPIPMNVESEFQIDELFFSRTDSRGLILSGNSVFQRVSKYEFDELLNRPHNVIRHPDMPRAVFRVLWNALKANEAVAAYVKNMAKDGSYYWVLAYVVPVGAEYLSVRLKPSSNYFPVVERVYAEMVSLERQIERETSIGSVASRREDAMNKSTEYLLHALAGIGFTSYDDFINTAMPAELMARDRSLPSNVSHAFPIALHDGRAETWSALYRTYDELGSVLDGFLANLDTFTHLETTMRSKSNFLENLGEDIRLFALNAILACDVLGSRGDALAAVASLMRDRSNSIGSLVSDLITKLMSFAEVLRQIGFLITTSRLQNEQGTIFVKEILGSDGASSRSIDDLHALITAQRDTMAPLQGVLHQLDDNITSLLACMHALKRELRVMQVLHVNGQVESAGIPNNTAIIALFHTIGNQVRTAMTELADFEALEALAAENYRKIGSSIETLLTQIDDDLGAVSSFT